MSDMTAMDSMTEAEKQSAQQFISNYLSQFGLGALGNWAWAKQLQGATQEQIMLEARQTPEYQVRFPAMNTLQQKGLAWNESQYMNYEQQAHEALAAAGIPHDTGMYSPDYLAKFIENDWSVSEIHDELAKYQQAVSIDAYSAAAKSIYGVDDGHLLAMFLDPQAGSQAINRKYGAVMAQGEATNAGYGQLSKQEAEYLSQFQLSQNQLQSGFGKLAATPENALPGEADANAVDRQTQLQAVAGNVEAQQRISQRQAQLASATEGSAQFTQAKEGSGVGSAQQPF